METDVPGSAADRLAGGLIAGPSRLPPGGHLPVLVLLGCSVASLVASGFVVAGTLDSVTLAALPPLATAAIGAIIATRQARNPIGWLLLAASVLLVADTLLQGYSVSGFDPQAAATVWAAWWSGWLWAVPLVILATFVPLLFPAGRLLSRRWRLVAGLAIAGVACDIISAGLMPGRLQDIDAGNPLGLDGAKGALDALNVLAGVLVVLSIALAGASVIVRYRRVGYEERRQIEWLAYVAVLAFAGLALAFVSTLVHAGWSELAGSIGWVTAISALVLGMPLAIGVAILRYRLYDIDWIINRTLVYVPLTALLAGAYIAVTGIFRSFLSHNGGGNSDLAVALTTVGVVAGLTPAKNYLQETVDRYFKEARNPATELDKLAATTKAQVEVLDRERYLQRFLASTAAILGARGARLALDAAGHGHVFSHGAWDGEAALSAQVTHDGRDYGVLQVSERSSGRPYSGPEQEALTRSAAVIAYLLGLRVAAP